MKFDSQESGEHVQNFEIGTYPPKSNVTQGDYTGYESDVQFGPVQAQNVGTIDCHR